ncbi:MULTISPECIES: chemotaxis protein CheV [Salinivibrio]|uniref:Chemotaxis protein CheV n=3 Tax=Salinivibrio TaxID=51366 RepID=A0AA47KP67_9GAMM|nr:MULTISPECIES: chemotaxis protein CheV [Salinivibrio]KKA43552.1 chemotaxis protein CheW [Salinivibrio sp. KP-1]MPS30928.1 chemotaxis signal transduction protein CheV [Salinivibrio sp. VYel7]MPX89531.1 chemotaxis signal transduction protein CheV [Salinivibrio sp. VYel1]MPX92329.1 chemotaxis signal transduction protein CheV [Salinivibrio sp. VYel9]MPX97095.1 chemotaxis signal transduction protein CheV [Salinivibrio sp. VYel6]
MKSKANQAQGMLMFRLTATQSFAIGTLKVREIIPFQPLTDLPGSHPTVIGTTSFRGIATPVIDMAKAIGYKPVAKSEWESCYIIVTDCQRRVMGFLVRGIDKISECDWRSISEPPETLGTRAFLTGVMNIDDKLVQLLDVEYIMEHIFPSDPDKLHPILADVDREKLKPMNILLVDDSLTARRQLSEALDSINIPYFVTNNGLEALQMMKNAASAGKPFDIIVSDIEMPGIDGYELAFEIRSDDKLAEAYLILHTSLSSDISVDRAKQVGAHEALTKFDATELVQAMLRGAMMKTSGSSVKLEGSPTDY